MNNKAFLQAAYHNVLSVDWNSISVVKSHIEDCLDAVSCAMRQQNVIHGGQFE